MAKKSIEERIQRLEDIKEVENLMAKYAYLHTAGKHEETAALFAKKTPGIKMEIGPLGAWTGPEGVYKAMVKVHKAMGVNSPGGLFVHPQNTPVIEIAGDGKTAKGVWMSPGLETRKGADGKLTGFWLWGHYGVDFVKEDGKWYFWHLHVYPYLMTPYDKSWTEPRTFTIEPLLDELKSDQPATNAYFYSTTTEMKYAPVPPEPYETFDEKTAY